MRPTQRAIKLLQKSIMLADRNVVAALPDSVDTDAVVPCVLDALVVAGIVVVADAQQPVVTIM